MNRSKSTPAAQHLSDAQMRAAWAKHAAKVHAWPNSALPERRDDGSFEHGEHESDYQTFKAGAQFAQPSETVIHKPTIEAVLDVLHTRLEYPTEACAVVRSLLRPAAQEAHAERAKELVRRDAPKPRAEQPQQAVSDEREVLYRQSDAFDEYWEREQECPEHSLTTRNAAHVTWHAACGWMRALFTKATAQPTQSQSDVPAVSGAQQVPGFNYPTTYADLARITPDQIFRRWLGERAEATISPREAFAAGRAIPAALSAPAAQQPIGYVRATSLCNLQTHGEVTLYANKEVNSAYSREVIPVYLGDQVGGPASQEQPSETAIHNATRLHSIVEAARCLGVAQEKGDKAAAAYWSDKVDSLLRPSAQEAESMSLEEAVRRANATLAAFEVPQEAAREQPADERKDADESDRLFVLIAEIRAACGDNGQRMQDDLVAHIAAQANHADTYRWLRENWFRIYGQSSGAAGFRIDFGEPWNSSGRPEHVDAAIQRCRALAEKGERNV